MERQGVDFRTQIVGLKDGGIASPRRDLAIRHPPVAIGFDPSIDVFLGPAEPKVPGERCRPRRDAEVGLGGGWIFELSTVCSRMAGSLLLVEI